MWYSQNRQHSFHEKSDQCEKNSRQDISELWLKKKIDRYTHTHLPAEQ